MRIKDRHQIESIERKNEVVRFGTSVALEPLEFAEVVRMKKLNSIMVCLMAILVVAGCARQNAGAPAATTAKNAAGFPDPTPNAPSRFTPPASQLASISDETAATVANLGYSFLQDYYANYGKVMQDGGCSWSYEVADAIADGDFEQSARSYCQSLQRRGFSANCGGIDALVQQITMADYTLLGQCANDSDVSQMVGTTQQLASAISRYRQALGLSNQMF